MKAAAQALKGHLDVLLLAGLEDGRRHGYAVKETLAGTALLPLTFTWPLAIATAASLTRLTLTARVLPRLFTG